MRKGRGRKELPHLYTSCATPGAGAQGELRESADGRGPPPGKDTKI